MLPQLEAQVAAATPGSPEELHARGQLALERLRLGESQEALEALQRLRILEEKLDSIPLAIADLEAARRLQPTDAAVLGHLDRLYAGLGRHRERRERRRAAVGGVFRFDTHGHHP